MAIQGPHDARTGNRDLSGGRHMYVQHFQMFHMLRLARIGIARIGMSNIQIRFTRCLDLLELDLR